MKAALRIIPPTLLFLLTISEVDIGSMEVEVPTNIHNVLFLCKRWQHRGQSDKMASETEVCMKHKCITELLHVEKMAPTDIHQWLLNIYGDQTMKVSRLKYWVLHFSNNAVIATVKSLLLRIFMSIACKLFMISGENAWLIVVTTLENSILQERICSIKQCYLCICYSSHGNKDVTFRSVYIQWLDFRDLISKFRKRLTFMLVKRILIIVVTR